MTLFSGLRKLGRGSRGPDRRFGTGLWRQHHDRFLRAVDRYYATSVAIAETSGSSAARAGGATSASSTAGISAETAGSTGVSERIAAGTHRLNDLVPVLDDVVEWLHTHHPVDGQVVPAQVRSVVGDAPELLGRASAKVAEAVLAASMARTELLAGRHASSSAQACERFIADAADLVGRVRSGLPVGGLRSGPDWR